MNYCTYQPKSTTYNSVLRVTWIGQHTNAELGECLAEVLAALAMVCAPGVLSSCRINPRCIQISIKLMTKCFAIPWQMPALQLPEAAPDTQRPPSHCYNACLLWTVGPLPHQPTGIWGLRTRRYIAHLKSHVLKARSVTTVSAVSVDIYT